ncbi:MAG: hypothetical protein U9Q78_02780 [Chloroflexota bacterium]|nr:hypothetical protein [Chloroflexota bacterium]
MPHFRWSTQLMFVSPSGQRRLFGGEINVFLDPHATRFPILGRDVLDQFVMIFDRDKNQVLLIEEPDRYQVMRTR